MISSRGNRVIRCNPYAFYLPLYFLSFVIVGAWMAVYFNAENDTDGVLGGILVFVLSFIIAIIMLPLAFETITLSSEALVYKKLFSSQKIVMEYSKCNIGLDYHIQNGNKIWWIYLTYGYKPKYPSKNKRNRINAEKIRPGFVKIMYSDIAFEALIDVLPQKQKDELVTARRFAGFASQGKIIF